MKRLYNLDYLRGLAAFGIMIYHYFIWTSGGFTSESFMGRLGVYGVSIFYILSGLTLFHVYFEKMEFSKKGIISFFKKRIFRIFPLLWLVTILSIFLSKKTPNHYDLFLNLTGLFGFIQWEKYFSVGVWSIGNELVFYVLFPFFIFFTKRYKPIMFLIFILFLGLYLYFAFYVLKSDLKLSEQWKDYVNPLNQAFLFLSGFLVGYFLNNIKVNNLILLGFIFIGLGLFVFFPASGDVINIVTGPKRLIFTFSCLLISVGFYKITFQLPRLIHRPLTIMGESSYSIYLLHPLVWIVIGFVSNYLRKNIFDFPVYIQFLIAVFCTLTISNFVYHHFEKYFMKFGKEGLKKT
jgi:peptidoglycan/LPS O-acetylase OafA/YrhL